MRASSYPPFVVFFDTVAVLLFILILNQSKGVEFRIPADRLFDGGEIVVSEGEELKYFKSGEVVDVDTPEVTYSLPCAQQQECLYALAQHPAKRLFVLLPSKLIGELSLTATMAAKSGCPGFVGIVGINGTLDRQATLTANTCMNSIPGVVRWVGRQKQVD